MLYGGNKIIVAVNKHKGERAVRPVVRVRMRGDKHRVVVAVVKHLARIFYNAVLVVRRGFKIVSVNA